METSSNLWQPDQGDSVLEPGWAQVWRVPLVVPPGMLPPLAQLLSPAEQAQAGRFRFPRGQLRFITAHAALRLILSRFVALPPTAFEFSCNAYGKPDFALPVAPDVRFNLAHSGDMALVAVALERTVGVDVEQIRHAFGGEAVARRFFAPGEVEVLMHLPEADRVQAFFNCWTRKEAYVKAIGQGLTLGLSSFEVSLAPSVTPALLACYTDPAQLSRWAVYDLALGSEHGYAPGFAGALVVEKPCLGWMGWDWTWANF